MANPCAPRHAIRPFGLALFLGLSSASAGRADLIKYQYGGVITAADASTGVAVGTRFAGTFAYDPDEAPIPPGSTGIPGSYTFGRTFGAIGTPDSAGLTAAVGNKTISEQQGGIALDVAGRPGSSSGAGSEVVVSNRWFHDLEQTNVSLQFANADYALFPTLAPPRRLDLADFTSANFVVTSGTIGPDFPLLYRGAIDTLTPVPTPEPSTWVAFGVAAVGIVLRGSRRRPGSPDRDVPRSRRSGPARGRASRSPGLGAISPGRP